MLRLPELVRFNGNGGVCFGVTLRDLVEMSANPLCFLDRTQSMSQREIHETIVLFAKLSWFCRFAFVSILLTPKLTPFGRSRSR